jgi:hypothetical protein
MRFIRTFGNFWYDFIVGDDWRLAIGAVAAIGLTYLAAHQGANWWWILPIAVAGLLSLSLTMATRRPTKPAPPQT